MKHLNLDELVAKPISQITFEGKTINVYPLTVEAWIGITKKQEELAQKNENKPLTGIEEINAEVELSLDFLQASIPDLSREKLASLSLNTIRELSDFIQKPENAGKNESTLANDTSEKDDTTKK